MAAKKKTSTKTEEFTVSGENVLDKLKELVAEGTVRRIIIRNKSGKTIAEFPLAIGVVGAVALPAFAAVGTIIALVAECTISVVKESK